MKRQQKSFWQRIKPDGRKWFPIFCLVPWIIGFVMFTADPIIKSLQYSFSITKFRPDASISLTFVGWDNYYTVLMEDTQFKLALPSYLQQMFFMVPIMVTFSLLTAVMLNSHLHFKQGFRVIFFLPVILMQGVLYEILTGLDAMSLSGVDDFFVFEFIEQNLPQAISSPILYIMDNFITIIWMCGVQILVCLAGLQRIDSRIYEAAYVDGASSWQSFWKITLPMTKTFIVLCGVYSVVDLSTSALNPLITIIKDKMFDSGSGFGFSAAVTWLYFLLILLFVLLAAFLCNGCRISGEKKQRVK